MLSRLLGRATGKIAGRMLHWILSDERAISTIASQTASMILKDRATAERLAVALSRLAAEDPRTMARLVDKASETIMDDRRKAAYEQARRQLAQCLPRVHEYLRRQADEGGYCEDYSAFKPLELVQTADRTQAKVILELGGGGSTAAFAEYAAANDAVTLVSVDESEFYLNQTRERLHPAVRDSVRFSLCPPALETDAGQEIVSYEPRYRDLLPGKTIDLCFVDGPSSESPNAPGTYNPCVDVVKLIRAGYTVRTILFDSRYPSVEYFRRQPESMHYDCEPARPLEGDARLWKVAPIRRATFFHLRGRVWQPAGERSPA